jgi:hypothetical protein
MYSVLNAQDLIYESLTSVARAVDEIRVYDGRFSDYRCACGKEHDNSCDGTSREIEQFLAEYPEAPPLKLIQWPAMPEMEKRTRMMRDVPTGTVTLTLDDEEVFFGRSKPLRDFAEQRDYDAGYVDFLFAENGHGTGVPIPLARLVRTTPGIRYEAYYRILDDEGVVVDMKADNVGVPYHRRMAHRYYVHPSARIVSLWHFRGQARERAGRDYNKLIGPRGWK